MKILIRILTFAFSVALLLFALLSYNAIKADSSINTFVITPKTFTPKPVSSPTPSPTIYEIKGSLSNLSNSQKKSMEQWRNDIVEDVRNNVYKKIVINGAVNYGKTVALTFDDCPDSINTPKVLDILKKNGIKASFFMIGQNVKSFPTVTKRSYNEGHLVLSHSYTHPQFTTLKTQKLLEELTLTENIINKAIGKKPAIIRPPYGDINKAVMSTLNTNGYTTVIWSIDTLDWANPKSKNNVVNNVIDNVRPGEIVLMHGYKDITVKALPEIIKKLKDKGYKFLKLDEMLGVKAYK